MQSGFFLVIVISVAIGISVGGNQEYDINKDAEDVTTGKPLRKATTSGNTLTIASRTTITSLMLTTRTSVDGSIAESPESFAKTKSMTASKARTPSPSIGPSSDQTTNDLIRLTTIEKRTDTITTPSSDQASKESARTTLDEKRKEAITTTSSDQATNDLLRTTTDETRTNAITISSKTTALAKVPKSTLTPTSSSDLTTKGLGERTIDPQRTTYDDQQKLETTLSSNESGIVWSFTLKNYGSP